MPLQKSTGKYLCDARVYRGRDGMGQCRRQGTMPHDGKSYCAQHFPENVSRKRTRWEERFQANREFGNAKDERENTAAAIVGAVVAEDDFDHAKVRALGAKYRRQHSEVLIALGELKSLGGKP